MFYIYILKLQNGKYYIGKTHHLKNRMNDHFNSKGSSWTKIHPPLKILKQYKTNDSFEEDKMTLMYMKDKGINNVRGGSFSSKFLSPCDLQVLQKMIRTQEDKCFQCGSLYHFKNQCPVQKSIQNVYYKEEIKDIKEIVKEESNTKFFITQSLYAIAFMFYIVGVYALYMDFLYNSK